MTGTVSAPSLGQPTHLGSQNVPTKGALGQRSVSPTPSVTSTNSYHSAVSSVASYHSAQDLQESVLQKISTLLSNIFKKSTPTTPSSLKGRVSTLPLRGTLLSRVKNAVEGFFKALGNKLAAPFRALNSAATSYLHQLEIEKKEKISKQELQKKEDSALKSLKDWSSKFSPLFKVLQTALKSPCKKAGSHYTNYEAGLLLFLLKNKGPRSEIMKFCQNFATSDVINKLESLSPLITSKKGKKTFQNTLNSAKQVHAVHQYYLRNKDQLDLLKPTSVDKVLTNTFTQQIGSKAALGKDIPGLDQIAQELKTENQNSNSNPTVYKSQPQRTGRVEGRTMSSGRYSANRQ